MTIDEMLDAGARLLETHGWVQIGGRIDLGLSPNCASNAIGVAAGWADCHLDAQYALRDYLDAGSRGLGTIFAWNDAPGQTKENVIATMRACAAIWRAKQENTDANDTRPQVCIPERSRDEPAGVPGEAVRRDTVSAGDD